MSLRSATDTIKCLQESIKPDETVEEALRAQALQLALKVHARVNRGSVLGDTTHRMMASLIRKLERLQPPS